MLGDGSRRSVTYGNFILTAGRYKKSAWTYRISNAVNSICSLEAHTISDRVIGFALKDKRTSKKNLIASLSPEEVRLDV